MPKNLYFASSSIHCHPFYQSFTESVSALVQNLNAFGNLKTLLLVKVLIPSADETVNLFSDCGILEYLSMERCRFQAMELLNISALKLRKLIFVNLVVGNRIEYQFRGGLKIHAPSLVSFYYAGPALCPCEFSDMPSLNDVTILVPYGKVSFLGLGQIVSYHARAKTLSLSFVVVLYFSRAFGGSPGYMTQFHNLRSLKVELVWKAECMDGLINLLKHSPNLEVLYVKIIPFSHGSSESSRTIPWKSRKEDVACLLHHLKEVEITHLRNASFLLEIIEFFLLNGKSLVKIQIRQMGEKVNPEQLCALQSGHVASEAVYVSVISESPSGEKELLQVVYGNGRSS